MAGEVIKFQDGAPAPRRSFDEVMHMAESFARSNLFGAKTVDQALALMMMAEAEGKHVATAMQDYDIIQGRPALKADAMLGRFQLAGGHVKWLKMTDDECAAEFSHPTCAAHVIDWDMDRAKAAGLGGKDNWRKFKRQMLRARVIAEGVRSTFPACLRGAPHYVSEEVQDFEPAHTHVSPQTVRGQLAAPNDAGQHEERSEPPPSSIKVTFTGDNESDGLPKGKSAYAAKKDGDWQRVSARLDEELKDCATKAEAKIWWEKVRTTDEEYQALPEAWRKTYRDEHYMPVLAGLDDEAQMVEWTDEPGARG